jgi:hypothetical protein
VAFQQTRAAALNLVTAAIILFNCRYLNRALAELRRRGTPIDLAMLPKLSPSRLQARKVCATFVHREPRSVACSLTVALAAAGSCIEIERNAGGGLQQRKVAAGLECAPSPRTLVIHGRLRAGDTRIGVGRIERPCSDTPHPFLGINIQPQTVKGASRRLGHRCDCLPFAGFGEDSIGNNTLSARQGLASESAYLVINPVARVLRIIPGCQPYFWFDARQALAQNVAAQDAGARGAADRSA